MSEDKIPVSMWRFDLLLLKPDLNRDIFDFKSTRTSKSSESIFEKVFVPGLLERVFCISRPVSIALRRGAVDSWRMILAVDSANRKWTCSVPEAFRKR